jgi:glutathione synthase/RimK-type ligase-like ATP-grasp enzyme
VDFFFSNTLPLEDHKHSDIVLIIVTTGNLVAKIIVIVEKLKDWTSYYPVEKLMTPEDYLVNWDEKHDEALENNERIKIINLCRNYKYLSNGYYCSLLAEARGHSVIPSVKAINDLSKSTLYGLATEDLDMAIQKAFKSQVPTDGISVTIYFGRTEKEQLQDVARQIFDLFPTPILHVDFEWDKKWSINTIRTGSLNSLSEIEEDKFAKALDEYSSKIWRKPKAKKKYRYDLAILQNPQEQLPPSDKKALQNFIKAGKELDVQVELIEKKDFGRIAEYDALFIRETTSITNHTYRFAKKAEAEGLICIDDSMSILRCTNKIYLQNLLHSNNINSPKTLVIGNSSDQLKEAIEEIGLPMIIKIPDGSFSKGIFKINSIEELKLVTDDLFKKTALLLAQEYFYTDFDWRIGILNDRPIFACKYYMTKGHWQIYDHTKKIKNGVESGDTETFPISKVPKNVITTALKLSHQMGNSLYGVDLKEKNGKAYVIEINDNPNIDSNIEDAIAGMDLYHNIIHDFIKRIEEKKWG